jgi:hypothetical protein
MDPLTSAKLLALVICGMWFGPLLIAFTSARWFRRLPTIRTIQRVAPEIDGQRVTFLSGTLAQIRQQANFGDQLVIVHHLPGAVNACVGRLGRNLIVFIAFQILASFLFLIFNLQPAQGPTTVPISIEFIVIVLGRIAIGSAITDVLQIAAIIAVLHFFFEETRRYHETMASVARAMQT